MSGTIVVGTAGWSIPRAAADRCPGQGRHLERYGAHLCGVEINSSFARAHRVDTYRRWADSVPDAFRFAVKLPRAITHERRLFDCDALVDRFAGEVAGLGAKLGPLLVQLPPRAVFDAAVTGAFFVALRARIDAPVVCEPRHATWFEAEADALLAAHEVSRVAADPARFAGAGEPGGWDGLAYVRLHGSPRLYASDYAPGVITATAARLVRYAASGRPAWCIFDNIAAGHALDNALALIDELGSNNGQT